MTKADKARMAEWAAEVYRKAQEHADDLDPKRRHASDAGRAFDNMAGAAKWAHWYLTGRHVGP